MTALHTINREDGLSVICNLHALDVARTFCDRIIGMSAGRVVFDGPPVALTTEIVRQIYNMDAGGKVEPIVVETDNDGFVGYHAAVAVRSDSPFQTIDDLRGKSFAFVDPNSTSGYIAPVFFLREDGITPDTFFGRTGFSGSHENSIIAVLNGTYDAAATWWTNEQRSNVARMEGKDMIPPGQIRYIWKSPKLPGSPWAMRTDLADSLKAEIRTALLALPTADPQAWQDLTDGKNKTVQEIPHADYEPIIRMIKDNQRSRRDAKSN